MRTPQVGEQVEVAAARRKNMSAPVDERDRLLGGGLLRRRRSLTLSERYHSVPGYLGSLTLLLWIPRGECRLMFCSRGPVELGWLVAPKP